MDPSSSYIIILISLICSAFFSGMEIAYITSNKLAIELDGKSGGAPARIIAFFNNRPSRFIGTMLLGNNIALVIFGIGMAQVLEPPIAEHITSNEGLVLFIQTVLSTLIVLGFAEFLPKTIFRINPNKTLSVFAIPLIIVYYLLWIPMILTIGMSEHILKLVFKIEVGDDKPVFGRIDLDDYVKDSTARAQDKEDLDHEIHIFKNALSFKDVKARDCMVPRTEIIAFDINDEIEELKAEFVETGLSKILIYRDSIDNIIGYVHAFEMFKKPEHIKSVLLPVGLVPESKPAQLVLEELTKQKRSIAVVVDEYGGTSGIVTIEDVMEEIFGEIEDEHDSEVLIEDKVDEDTFILSARHEIHYINEKYDLQIPDEEEYETIAGLILHHTETIPDKGEQFSIEDFTIKILDASSTKIETVKLSLKDSK